jgi:putative nucleotidyltransferase with HDIG domain
VDIAASLHASGLLWTGAEHDAQVDETRRRVLSIAPDEERTLDPSEIDTICEAFAEVVDAKSPFTYRHSLGVANAANAIARQMDLPEARRQMLGRASLLHDIGKLSVSNSILDKPSALTVEEWRMLNKHPGLTRQILARVSAFGELARIAGEHHEMLDGTGYPDQLLAKDLCLESRILTVADVYGALAEDRPYRVALGMEEMLSIIQGLAPHKLDGECVAALVQVIAKDGSPAIYSPGTCAKTATNMFGRKILTPA